MKTQLLNSYALLNIRRINFIMPLAILVLWFAIPKLLGYLAPTAGMLDEGIIQLVLLGFTCYFLLLLLSWWLLNHSWQLAGLPNTKQMVLQFQTLMSWQQLGFYWASFALLLLAGVGVLAAVL